MSETVSARPVKRERPLKRLPQILVSFFLVLYTAFFAYRVVAAALYPYPIEYGEGAVLYEVYHLTLGDPYYLYKDNSAPPYRAAIYTPLYYYTGAIPVYLAGVPSFAGGRALSALAAILATFLLYRACRIQELVIRAGGREQRIRLSRRTALCVAVTPLATAPVYAWGALYKPDMIAVALSISAIFVVFLYVERGDPRSASLNISGFNVAAAAKLGLSPSDVAAADHRRYAAYVSQATWAALGAGLLCALAVFTKQSALAAPSAIFFFLALRDRRLALFFAVAFGGLSALFIIIFQPLTDGQFFTHVVSYNGQNFELDWLTTALGFLVGTHPVLLFFSLIYVYGEFRAINFTGVTTVFPGVWPLYFITALVTTFSAGKVGSNYNYYIELLFVASLLSWWFIARLLAIRPQLPLPIAKWKLPLAGAALLLMFIQLILLHHFPIVADGSDTPGPAQWQQGETVAAEVKRLGTLGPLLAEDSGWQAIANLPADLDDSFVFGQLAQDGQWNQQNFLKELRAGRYKNVMLQISAPDDTSEAALDQLVQSGAYAPFPGRFSPEMLSFIKQNYKPEKRFGHYLFLSLKS